MVHKTKLRNAHLMVIQSATLFGGGGEEREREGGGRGF